MRITDIIKHPGEGVGLAKGRPTLRMIVSTLEKRVILACLARNNWKKIHTARDLGLSRPGLDKKIHRYGIDVIEAKNSYREPGPVSVRLE